MVLLTAEMCRLGLLCCSRAMRLSLFILVYISVVLHEWSVVPNDVECLACPDVRRPKTADGVSRPFEYLVLSLGDASKCRGEVL